MKKIQLILFVVFAIYAIAIQPRTALAATHNIDDPTQWNIRIDGEQSDTFLGQFNFSSGDVNHDGVDDLMITVISPTGYLGRTNINITYVIYSTLLASLHGKGNIIDLANSANYNLKIVAAATNDRSPYYSVEATDINNNGINDLILGEGLASTDGRVRNGAVYIIYDSLLSGYVGTGNIVDLADSSTYNVKMVGADSINRFGYSIGTKFDFDGNGKKDLIIDAEYASSTNGVNSGSVYVIKNEIFSNIVGTGNVIDMAISSNYNVRIDGPGGTLMQSFLVGNSSDVNGDGIDDAVVYSAVVSNNAVPNSGSAYIIYSTTLAGYVGTGNIINLADSSKYNLRIDGVHDGSAFGFAVTQAVDINGNGKNDLIMADYTAEYNGRVNSGSVFVLFDSLLAQHAVGMGQSIDLTNASNFNIRFDGSVGFGGLIGSNLGSDFYAHDFDNDGTLDFFVDAVDLPGAYIIKGPFFSSVTGTGNIVDMANAASYDTFFTSGVGLEMTYAPIDLNHDGKTDYAVVNQNTDYHGLSQAGSIYIIYNFPHSIAVAPLDQTDGLTTTTIHGTVDAEMASSTTNVAGVQYRVDSNSPTTAGWTNCTADDGTFNSTLESFTCAVSAFSTSTHTIYVRAYDPDISYTPQASYASVVINTAVLPTVTTQASTAISDIGTTFHGTVTATGGSSPLTRGFQYGLTLGYGSSTVEHGIFIAESFTTTTSDLACGSQYHVRAYATSVVGTAYGDDVLFTTNPCPAVTTSSFPAGHIGFFYSQTLTAEAGSASYANWIITSGQLPSGLALNGTTGVISGTPTTATAKHFSISVVDSHGSISSPVSLVINIPSLPAEDTGGGGIGSVQALAPLVTTYQVSGADQLLLNHLKDISLNVGDLVKLPDDHRQETQEDSAVYLIGSDGRRHAFSNAKVYFSWYADFSMVREISASSLASIPLGHNVTYKPGTRMVKFITDPKVYVVEEGGVLRWIKTEQEAMSLYGRSWNARIDDVSDAFYGDYTL